MESLQLSKAVRIWDWFPSAVVGQEGTQYDTGVAEKGQRSRKMILPWVPPRPFSRDESRLVLSIRQEMRSLLTMFELRRGSSLLTFLPLSE